ncbi:MAG: TolC family protein [Hydrogenovibrio sp.]
MFPLLLKIQKKTILKGFVATFCFIPVITLVHAQENTQKLTLKNAILLTLEQNPELKSFVFQKKIYEGIVKQVSVSQRPQVELTVEDMLGTGNYNGLSSAQTTLSISWLLDQQQVEGRVASAKSAIDQVGVERETKALDLSAYTARLFIETLVNHDRLKVANLGVEQAKQAIGIIQKRVNVGKNSEIDLFQAQQELIERELMVEGLHHDLGSALYKLSSMWGTPTDHGITLEGNLVQLPQIKNIAEQQQKLISNPKFKLFATKQRMAESEIELARIESKPQWQLTTGVRRYNATDDYGLVAGITVPWGENKASAGKIHSLQAKKAQLDSESSAFKNQLNAQVYVLLKGMEHSQYVIKSLKTKTLPLLEKTIDQATKAYEIGQIGFQQWNTSQQKLLSAKYELLSAYEKIHLQNIEIQRLTGETLN